MSSKFSIGTIILAVNRNVDLAVGFPMYRSETSKKKQSNIRMKKYRFTKIRTVKKSGRVQNTAFVHL